MSKGKLFLIPSVLAADTSGHIISPQVKAVVQETKHFLVEELRTARRYISSLKLGVVIDELHFEILDKKTRAAAMPALFAPIFEGKDIGIISEAGCPGIADPGSVAVAYAHEKGIQVVPLSGPSAMFLALMASGFNGQSFAFHGYLPIDKKARIAAIRELEADSLKNRRTQIFMETPFRNNHLFQDLITNLHPFTKLCIAKNLTGSDELVLTKNVADWKKTTLDLHKIPTVFILYAGE
jgi:16S rRNA (cytidine1402-2'-O)-methyltransferase